MFACVTSALAFGSVAERTPVRIDYFFMKKNKISLFSYHKHFETRGLSGFPENSQSHDFEVFIISINL